MAKKASSDTDLMFQFYLPYVCILYNIIVGLQLPIHKDLYYGDNFPLSDANSLTGMG